MGILLVIPLQEPRCKLRTIKSNTNAPPESPQMTSHLDPSSTAGYYNDRAEKFFSPTLRVVMSPIY
jgi:hypothetical protein